MRDAVLFFNILHGEDASLMLRETRSVLAEDGTLPVIRWNYDPNATLRKAH